MNKILMLAIACTITAGAFANNNKPKKHKQCQQCTQQKCTPDCMKKGACIKSNCDKS